MESATNKARANMPFIMPDGRPLGHFLRDNNLERAAPGRSRLNRPGAPKAARREGWDRDRAGPGAPHAWRPTTDAECAELEAVASVGQRRQRRWLNDKLLRDMAGQLTAADMEGLFKPAPFGREHVSLWTQAVSAEHAYLWDLFRSVDMDKQQRVLQKWEEHVGELRGDGSEAGAAAEPAVRLAAAALAAWAGVTGRARDALKHSNPAHVEAIEAPILSFASQDGGAPDTAPGQPQELELDLESGFHRLLAHGLAQYHGLRSTSASRGTAQRVVVLHRPAQPDPPAPGGGAPAALTEALPCCADFLLALGGAPQHGLCAAVLADALRAHGCGAQLGGLQAA